MRIKNGTYIMRVYHKDELWHTLLQYLCTGNLWKNRTCERTNQGKMRYKFSSDSTLTCLKLYLYNLINAILRQCCWQGKHHPCLASFHLYWLLGVINKGFLDALFANGQQQTAIVQI